jgi:hypothetical protein
MSNPALELAQILTSWEIPQGHSAVMARGNAANDLPFWHKHKHAVSLISQIEDELAAMSAAGDDVSVYLALVPELYQGVFAYKSGFQPGVPNGALTLSASSLAMLAGLGLLLSKVGLTSVGSPTMRMTLLACVEDAVSLLEQELDGWDRTEKEYLFRILESARRALKENAVLGEVNLTALINELIGALTGIALDLRASEGPESTRFQRVMNWVGSTAAVLRGIVYDSEALTSLASSVGDVARQITDGQ